MPKTQRSKSRSKSRSMEYTDKEVKAAVYSMSNKEAANSLRAAIMAEEDARARAEARAVARAEARTEARRPGLENRLEQKFGKYQDLHGDLMSRGSDMMITLPEMTTEFREAILPEILQDEASRAARELNELKGLPSGRAWLSGITKSPYSASIKYRNNPGSRRAASGRKLYKTRNKKSRRGRRGKRTRRARNTRKARR